MEKVIHGKYFNQGEDLSEVLNIRKEIFGQEADERDPEAVNILIRLMDEADDPGIPIGCGRLNMDLAHFRFYIDQLGILEEYRKNGFGEFALRALVDKVNQCGAEKVFIEKKEIAGEEAEGFFRKMFFTPDEEEADFLSAKIDSFHTCCH